MHAVQPCQGEALLANQADLHPALEQTAAQVVGCDVRPKVLLEVPDQVADRLALPSELFTDMLENPMGEKPCVCGRSELWLHIHEAIRVEIVETHSLTVRGRHSFAQPRPCASGPRADV